MKGQKLPQKYQADKLYNKYVKPLEMKHKGEYIAITSKGQKVLGTTLLGVLQKATSLFGPGNFIFKVGDKAVGKWR